MSYVILDKSKVKLIHPQNGSYFVLTNYVIWKEKKHIDQYIGEISPPFINGFSIIHVDCDWETETVDSILHIDREYRIRKIIANRPLKCMLLKTFIWKEIQ